MLPLIIRLIYSALASNDIRILIIKLLKLYKNDSGLKSVLESENVSEEEINQPYSVFNPNIIKKFLSILKPNELKTLKTELDKLLFKPIKKISKLFNEDTKDEKNLNNKDINEEEIKDEKGWVILSSSWFKKGLFYITNKSLKLGVLQGLFQSDTSKNKRWYGPYIYPNVSIETWELMKVQKGKNGSGAGTIFWKYFLREFLPSQIRKYVKKQLKEQKGITKGRQSYYILKSNNINIIKTTAFINRLERGFFRLKEFKTLPKTELSSRAWRVERKEYLTIQKNNKNTLYTNQKNTNKYKKYK